LQTHLAVVPTRTSRLVVVNFSSPDPALAARIANAFADNFIAEGLDRRFQASSYARDFLERRLAEVKARLEDSERALAAYATQRQIIQLSSAGQPGGPESGQSLAAANLEAFTSALATARADRIRAEQRWRQAQGQSGLGLPDILQSPTIQVLSQEHAKLAAEYQDKLSIYKDDYPDIRELKARVDETDRQLAAEADTIRSALRAQYETALNSERAMTAEVEGLKAAVLDMRARTIRYTILQREVDTSRTLYDGLLQRYKEVGVEGGVTADNISIVDRAEVPDRPTRPKPALNMALAGVAGIVLGVALAFGLETFDQAIRAPGDVEARLRLPLLGVIPDQRNPPPRAALADGRSPLAEAYQSLRSALQFATRDGFPRSLLITSPGPGGGKSTTAFAIAQIMARLGQRVLLIDADLRRPSLHDLAGVANPAGLTNALTGGATLSEVIQPTSLATLSIITSGPLPPNPAELLAGARLRALLAEAADRFDVLILDGPPVLDLADAPLIGATVAGVLMVIEARRTTAPQAQAAIGRLSVGSARSLGAILTRVAIPPSAYGYGRGGQG
jgi:capsular exopolysaccharide synthesis family protein